MTTAQILKRLEFANSEQEMLALAAELGVAPSFFDIGSVVEAEAKKTPLSVARKPSTKRKRLGLSLGKKKLPKKASA